MISMRPAKRAKYLAALVTDSRVDSSSRRCGGAELEKATPWGYSIPFDLFLQRYRFGKKLKCCAP